MTDKRKFKLVWFVCIILNFIFLISSIQTSQGGMWEKKVNTSSSMIVNTSLKNELHIVSQIINRTTSDAVELVGNVTYIVDGDTLDINGIRIRLSLVDTPERGQSGYKEAKEFVSSVCLGKKGELDVDDGQRRGDRYGREIGIVYCDGININEKLMNEKLARILTDYCDISEFSNENWAKSGCNVAISSTQ